MTKKQGYALFAVCFLALEAALIAFADRPLSDYLRGLDETTPQFINFFRAYTDFGKSAWYLWPAAFGIFICTGLLRTTALTMEMRQRVALAGHRLVFFFGSIAGSGLITDLFKRLIGRARPIMLVREQFYGFRPFNFDAAWQSLPSGHATTAAALLTVLVLLFPRGKVLWIFLYIALMVSRCMVNAHFLSDVLAGSCVGILVTVWLARARDNQGKFPVIAGIFPIDKVCKNP
jgi:undecaprenyl-diphosphatase